MPKEDNIQFTNVHKQLEFPVLFIGDFESVLARQPKRQNNGKTIIIDEHIPCGYAYKVISNILPHLTKSTKVVRQEGCVETFIADIYNEYKNLKHIFEEPVDMIMMQEDIQKFKNATHCHICNEPLNWNDEENTVVRDHCHFTGKFRGAAHQSCNLKLKIPTRIPVIFHGLRNYDGHLIIKALSKFVNELSDIYVIPNTLEAYTTIYTKEFVFIDSYQHLSGSLDNLVSNLKDKGEQYFKNLIDEFPDDEIRANLFKKGLYPYNYIDSFQRFKEPIPERQHFENKLNNTTPSVDDYNDLLQTCNQLNITNLGQLHDHYVKLDVILLADVISNYRSMAIEEYKLDPMHYGTAPAFSYDAMLKFTNAKPELLKDPDMYLFMEQGIRGGMSVISHRLASANNKYLSNYDENKENTSIFYTDCSNLYGYAMSQPLPYSNFKWLTNDEINTLNVTEVNADADEGMILEVDLHYPKHLHDLHSDYPLAPESLTIKKEMLSPHVKEFLSTHKLNHTKQTRLAPNLYDKEKYIVHIKNLQLYLSLGLILTKIHRGIKFQQRAWLKPYIVFNTDKRRQAISKYEKDFFKLLINAIFGKMMENVRRYRNVRMISNGRQHALYVNKPQFKRFEIISEDLVIAELIKPEVTLNKAIYCGLAILDISKHRMFDFHYNCIKKHFPNAKLCFTDTDSLLYLLYTNNLYKELLKIKDELDLSNYPRNHPLYDATRRMTPGFFKDESEGIPIEQFCGLRAKCRSIKMEDDDQKLASYGITKSKNFKSQNIATAGVKKAVHNELTHERFLSVLKNNSYRNIIQRTINAKKHTLYTLENTRIGISALDIKRHILNDGITTLAYGHYQIKNE